MGFFQGGVFSAIITAALLLLPNISSALGQPVTFSNATVGTPTSTAYTSSQSPQNCEAAKYKALGNKDDGPSTSISDKAQSGVIDACIGAVLKDGATPTTINNYSCVGRSGKAYVVTGGLGTPGNITVKTSPDPTLAAGTCKISICPGVEGTVKVCYDAKTYNGGVSASDTGGITAAPAPSTSLSSQVALSPTTAPKAPGGSNTGSLFDWAMNPTPLAEQKISPAAQDVNQQLQDIAGSGGQSASTLQSDNATLSLTQLKENPTALQGGTPPGETGNTVQTETVSGAAGADTFGPPGSGISVTQSNTSQFGGGPPTQQTLITLDTQANDLTSLSNDAKTRYDAYVANNYAGDLNGVPQCNTGLMVIACSQTPLGEDYTSKQNQLADVLSARDACQAGNCPQNIIDAQNQQQGAVHAAVTSVLQGVDATRQNAAYGLSQLSKCPIVSTCYVSAALWSPVNASMYVSSSIIEGTGSDLLTLCQNSPVANAVGCSAPPAVSIANAANPTGALNDTFAAGARTAILLSGPTVSAAGKLADAFGAGSTLASDAGTLASRGSSLDSPYPSVVRTNVADIPIAANDTIVPSVIRTGADSNVVPFSSVRTTPTAGSPYIPSGSGGGSVSAFGGTSDAVGNSYGGISVNIPGSSLTTRLSADTGGPQAVPQLITRTQEAPLYIPETNPIPSAPLAANENAAPFTNLFPSSAKPATIVSSPSDYIGNSGISVSRVANDNVLPTPGVPPAATAPSAAEYSNIAQYQPWTNATPLASAVQYVAPVVDYSNIAQYQPNTGATAVPRTLNNDTVTAPSQAGLPTSFNPISSAVASPLTSAPSAPSLAGLPTAYSPITPYVQTSAYLNNLSTDLTNAGVNEQWNNLYAKTGTIPAVSQSLRAQVNGQAQIYPQGSPNFTLSTAQTNAELQRQLNQNAQAYAQGAPNFGVISVPSLQAVPITAVESQPLVDLTGSITAVSPLTPAPVTAVTSQPLVPLTGSLTPVSPLQAVPTTPVASQPLQPLVDTRYLTDQANQYTTNLNNQAKAVEVNTLWNNLYAKSGTIAAPTQDIQTQLNQNAQTYVQGSPDFTLSTAQANAELQRQLNQNAQPLAAGNPNFGIISVPSLTPAPTIPITSGAIQPAVNTTNISQYQPWTNAPSYVTPTVDTTNIDQYRPATPYAPATLLFTSASPLPASPVTSVTSQPLAAIPDTSYLVQPGTQAADTYDQNVSNAYANSGTAQVQTRYPDTSYLAQPNTTLADAVNAQWDKLYSTTGALGNQTSPEATALPSIPLTTIPAPSTPTPSTPVPASTPNPAPTGAGSVVPAPSPAGPSTGGPGGGGPTGTGGTPPSGPTPPGSTPPGSTPPSNSSGSLTAGWKGRLAIGTIGTVATGYGVIKLEDWINGVDTTNKEGGSAPSAPAKPTDTKPAAPAPQKTPGAETPAPDTTKNTPTPAPQYQIVPIANGANYTALQQACLAGNQNACMQLAQTQGYTGQAPSGNPLMNLLQRLFGGGSGGNSSTQNPGTTPDKFNPEVKLIANPNQVSSGGKSLLSWASVGTAQCGIYGPGNAVLADGPTSGSTSTPSLATSTAFVARCITISSSTVSTTTTVTVK